MHPSALEIALGLRPRAISRASGCKIPALGKSLGPRGVYFPIHPSSRQSTDSISCARATSKNLSVPPTATSSKVEKGATKPTQHCSLVVETGVEHVRVVISIAVVVQVLDT